MFEFKKFNLCAYYCIYRKNLSCVLALHYMQDTFCVCVCSVSFSLYILSLFLSLSHSHSFCQSTQYTFLFKKISCSVSTTTAKKYLKWNSICFLFCSVHVIAIAVSSPLTSTTEHIYIYCIIQTVMSKNVFAQVFLSVSYRLMIDKKNGNDHFLALSVDYFK